VASQLFNAVEGGYAVMSGGEQPSRTALITGGAKRIGKEIALTLAEGGIDIVVHFRSSEREAKELKEELLGRGVEAWLVKADFAEKAGYFEFLSRAQSKTGGLDFLVNNASIFPKSSVEELDFDEFERNMSVNAWAPFSLSRAFFEQSDHGKVVNLLDTRISGYDWNHVGYYFSKVLLERMTKMLALNAAPNFTVNGVAPGLISPPEGVGKEYLEERVSRVPMRRHGERSDVAEAVEYLLEADFVTGQIIYVDGGRNLLHELEG
jgi:pteridine reductase